MNQIQHQYSHLWLMMRDWRLSAVQSRQSAMLTACRWTVWRVRQMRRCQVIGCRRCWPIQTIIIITASHTRRIHPACAANRRFGPIARGGRLGRRLKFVRCHKVGKFLRQNGLDHLVRHAVVTDQGLARVFGGVIAARHWALVRGAGVVVYHSQEVFFQMFVTHVLPECISE